MSPSIKRKGVEKSRDSTDSDDPVSTEKVESTSSPKTNAVKDNSFDADLPTPRLNFGTASQVIFLCAVLVYIHTYDVGYLAGDIEAIVKNKDVNPGSSFVDIFSNDYHGNPRDGGNSSLSYRPIAVLSMRFDRLVAFGELVPVVCHMINIVIYGCTCVLALALFSAIFNESPWRPNHQARAPFIAALLFSLHPIHTENVASISGRADMLAYLFSACAILCYVEACKKAYTAKLLLFGCSVCSLFAVFCKEEAVSSLVICCVYDLFGKDRTEMVVYLKRIIAQTFGNEVNKDSVKLTIPKKFQLVITRQKVIAISLGCICFIRWGVCGADVMTQLSGPEEGGFGDAFFHVVNHNYLFLLKSFLLFIPAWSCSYWSAGCVLPVTSCTDYRFMAVVILWMFACSLVSKSCLEKPSIHKRLALVSLAFIACPLLPLVTPVSSDHVIAETSLFLPCAGACLLVTVGFTKLCQSSLGRKVAAVSMLLLLASYTMRTRQRASEWRDELKLYSADVKVCPESAKLHFFLGRLHLNSGAFDSAEEEIEHSLQLEPDNSEAIFQLGRLLLKQGKIKKAEKWIRKAIDIEPNNPDYWKDMGNIQQQLGHHDNAIKYFQKSVELGPQDGATNLRLAKHYKSQKNLKKAVEYYSKTIEMAKENEEAWFGLADALHQLGMHKEMAAVGIKATKMFPGNAELHHTTAISLHQVEQYKESEEHHNEAIKLKPKEQRYYLQLAAMYESWKRTDKANDAYMTGLKLNYTNQAVWGKLFSNFMRDKKLGLNLVKTKSNNKATPNVKMEDRPDVIEEYRKQGKDVKQAKFITINGDQ